MYTARFLYNIYEEKYAIIPYYQSWYTDEDWHLADEHVDICYSVGYKMHNVMRYVRIKERNVILHEEEIGIEFEKGDKVKINKEHFKILDVIKNLDGSIDYHIDKRVYIPLNTRETFFDERPKKEELPPRPEPPETSDCRIVYENFTGTKKEYDFWVKLSNFFKKRG